MSLLVLIFFSLLVAGMWAVAVYGWFESKYLWNNGVCAESGFEWDVIELEGHLFLDDCHGKRIGLPVVVIHPAITDALKQQRERLRV